MRRGKPDGNARTLDAVATGYGATLVMLDGVGRDAPDRLFGYWGLDQLAEYKNPDGRDTLSPGQAEMHERWRGRTVCVLRTEADMVVMLERMRLDAERLR